VTGLVGACGDHPIYHVSVAAAGAQAACEACVLRGGFVLTASPERPHRAHLCALRV
jgi:hypothetical protein